MCEALTENVIRSRSLRIRLQRCSMAYLAPLLRSHLEIPSFDCRNADVNLTFEKT